MEKSTKIILFSILGLSAAGLTAGFIWYKKNKNHSENPDSDKKDDETSNENYGSGNSGGGNSGGGNSSGSSSAPAKSPFDDLLANMGASAKKSQDGTTVNAAFNSSKNAVTFYNNGRFAIKDVASGKISKGSWSSGGKTLTVDGKKTITGGSVWTNLLNAIK